MALLMPSALLSSPDYITRSWQLKQHRQLRVNLVPPASWSPLNVNGAVLPGPVHPPVVRIVRHAEEEGPSAKELHRLRKKEEQKKLRKIRKERRAKHKAEELAKIPREKPNPALQKYEKPLLNWNKPWKNKKKENSAVTTQVGKGSSITVVSDESGRKDFRSKSKVQFQTSVKETSAELSVDEWSDFEAVYKDKFRKSAERIANKGGTGDPIANFKHNACSDTAVPCSGEAHDLVGSRSGGGSVPENNGGIEWSKQRDVDSTGCKDSTFSNRSRAEAHDFNAGAGDLAVVRGVSSTGKDELNTSVRSQTSRWEGLRSDDLRADNFSLRNQGQNKRAEWRGVFPNGNAISEVGGKDPDSAGYESEGSMRNAVYDYEMQQNLGTTRDVDGRFTVSRGSGQFADQPVALEKHREVLPDGAEQDVELSKFWDRRDMHLHEAFDTESLKEKFETSAQRKTRIVKDDFWRQAGRYSREIARVVIGRRKGENISLTIGDDDATLAKGLPREDVNEEKQLEWLAKQLNNFGRADGVHLSRVMRSGGVKITDGRAVVLVQRLGQLGNWRRAMQIVEWLNSRNHFPPLRSRYVFTTLLSVLGKARRPVESLSVFNVMREHVATYPDMAAYHVVAVTLGQAGHMEELCELIQSLRQGPARDTKYLLMVADGGRLNPDVVVYNAVLNSCIPRKQWRYALSVLDELNGAKKLRPNSATYGLAIEAMVKAGQFDLAWKILEQMQLGGFHPNALTFKALVGGLGQIGKADAAITVVKKMEERGIVAVFGVYYELACALCSVGRWKDAVQQVGRALKISDRPMVDSYTGLIMACKNAGRWEDAVFVFEHMRELCAPNIGTYNIIISIYGANQMYDEAKMLFENVKTGRMSARHLYKQDPRLSPDAFTFEAILGACTICKKWDDFEVIFRQMLLQGFQMDSKRHFWIVREISRAGKDHLVGAIFDHLRGLNAASSEVYVSMIKSCLRGGGRNVAFSFLEEMIKNHMRISVQDLENLREVAELLCDEDKSSFTQKVDDLTVTSKFNFKRTRRPGSSQQRYTLRPQQMVPSSSCLHECSRDMRSNSREKEDWQGGNPALPASTKNLHGIELTVADPPSEDPLTRHENDSSLVLKNTSWELAGNISGILS